VTDSELGWVAGILDGEGCIGLYRNSKNGRSASHTLRISVTNCDRPIIDELVRLAGGRTRLSGKTNPNWRPSWLWDLSGYAALDLLRLVRPALIGKVAQADLALKFTLVGKGRKRTSEQIAFNEELRQQLRLLKGHAQWLTTGTPGSLESLVA
jgi:hypothetical protein